MPRLRPYQAAVALAILRRALGDGAGGSLSVEIARQGGKNELSAQVELALLLARAGSGGTAVKCAPTLGQARISQRRLSQRATGAGLGGAFELSEPIVRCGAARRGHTSSPPRRPRTSSGTRRTCCWRSTKRRTSSRRSSTATSARWRRPRTRR
jgi:hypothetical protein